MCCRSLRQACWNFGARFVEAIEHNTHVREIDLTLWFGHGEDKKADKRLLSIEQSRSLQKLICSSYGPSQGRILQALSNRTTKLDYLHLPSIYEEVVGALPTFLLRSPEIENLVLKLFGMSGARRLHGVFKGQLKVELSLLECYLSWAH